MTRIVVVGAGFAGLAAADELQRSGAEVVVFEARGLDRGPGDSSARGACAPGSRSRPRPPRSSRGRRLARTVGPLAFAGEHTAGDWHGVMEGALRSGVRAARQLLGAHLVG
ncbi:MAG: Pyridine nucleotide-disulfide oxidoreductase [Solirubrobacterales bacterium]|nr:Pyridine nucleotide-disulfide oxidoreductase [Solirubrobacterales bacterium]